MFKVHSLINDSQVDYELLDNIKARNIDGKFNYLGEWAHQYIKSVDHKETINQRIYNTSILHTDGMVNFNKEITTNNIASPKHESWLYDFWFLEKYFRDHLKTSFVSLWCGDARKEKPILEALEKNEKKFDYIGVDSSLEMLHLAHQNLEGIQSPKKYLHADLMSPEFRNEIKYLTKKSDITFLGFLWWSFGNSNQMQLVENLYNTMRENDIY